jgi:hypothetical protein
MSANEVSFWNMAKFEIYSVSALCYCYVLEAAWLKWAEIWWEAPMEGSVLSFLKAEWKVSDTVLRYLERFKSYDQKKTWEIRFWKA